MPDGAILLGIILVRLIAYAARQNSPSSRVPRADARSGRGLHSNVGGITALRLLLLPVGVGLLVSALGGAVWALVPLAFIGTLAFPWPVARHFLIPLAFPKASYYTAWLSDWRWKEDRRGGAALCGALALLGSSPPDLNAIAWIEERLRKKPPLRGAGVAAMGFLALARSDHASARALLDSVLSVDRTACPKEARRISKEWLAAEAACRGDWKRVAELGSIYGDNSRSVILLVAIARRVLHDPEAPGRFGLRLRWLWAPCRVRTLALVRRTLNANGLAGASPQAVPQAPEGSLPETLRPALALHAAMLRFPPSAITGASLSVLGDAWSKVFEDTATKRLIAERAFAIGAASPERTLNALRASVESDLAGLALESEVDLAEWHGFGDVNERVATIAREQLLSDVELACESLRRRVDEKRELPSTDEWREWLTVQRTYERAGRIGGKHVRHLLFGVVHRDVGGLAVWLWNLRGEKTLANAMFQWMLHEAVALGATDAVELEEKNVACGP